MLKQFVCIFPQLPMSSEVSGCWKKSITNAESHGHTHQFSQSGQTRSCFQPITQCPIAWPWENALKQWAVMVIFKDKSLTFKAVLGGLNHCICFISVGQKQEIILNGFLFLSYTNKANTMTLVFTSSVELRTHSALWPCEDKCQRIHVPFCC